MKALILDNKVVDLSEKEFPVASPLKWIDAPEGCTRCWLLKEGVLVKPPDPPELTYSRKRKLAYPSIAELTVALYDTDDKADIEAKRAAVKAKYKKPE